jgi:hypothetical protein
MSNIFEGSSRRNEEMNASNKLFDQQIYHKRHIWKNFTFYLLDGAVRRRWVQWMRWYWASPSSSMDSGSYT